MISAQDTDGKRMSDRQLRDEAMTLYLAGHETTALTLTWCWYLLSLHPEADHKLVNEWREVLNGLIPGADDFALCSHAVVTECIKQLRFNKTRVRHTRGMEAFKREWDIRPIEVREASINVVRAPHLHVSCIASLMST